MAEEENAEVETTEASEPAPETEDTGKGSKDAVLADLARERKGRQALAARVKELEPLAAKAKELEDSSKSETEKLTERLTGSETRASKAEAELMRLRVALAKGLTLAQANRLVGTTEEELEKDADEFLKDIGGTPAPPSRRPTERLSGGSDPTDEPDETDPAKLAASIKATHY